MGFGGFAAGALGAIAPVAAIATGGQIASDMWSANEDRKAQKAANEANTASAREQMAFQENMSNTSYVRAMQDMKNAGLNPMLAFSQGGASTPAGAMSTSAPASKGGMGRAVSKGIEGGMSTAFKAQEMSNQNASTQSNVALQGQQANTAKTQQDLNLAMAKKAEQDALVNQERLKLDASREGREKDVHEYRKKSDQIDADYKEQEKWLNMSAKGAGIISDLMPSNLVGKIFTKGNSATNPPIKAIPNSNPHRERVAGEPVQKTKNINGKPHFRID